MSTTNEGLAKVLREHRRCRSVGGGLAYKCICGESVASNSHHVMSAHQAEKALEYLSDEEVTAEAKEQAELEAEALFFFNAFWEGRDALPIDSWDKEPGKSKQSWLAVARRARGMRAEK
ncbi:hypothetical protein ACT3UQ_08950 [Glutamicibacter sp. AOP12-B1-11]|uniref:hypothetical protein n=1 Tax=Glutamicibacter sp. AOP12-B1-11 TaxID=3457725 RepID=UPI004034C49A